MKWYQHIFGDDTRTNARNNPNYGKYAVVKGTSGDVLGILAEEFTQSLLGPAAKQLYAAVEESQRNTVHSESDLPRFSGEELEKRTGDSQESIFAATSGVNPKYMKTLGAVNNCFRCAVNYDLRRRGYDTTASTTPVGTRCSFIDDIYKGVKYDDYEMKKTIRSEEIPGEVRPQWGNNRRLPPKMVPATRQVNEIKESIMDSYRENDNHGCRGILFGFGSRMNHSMGWEVTDEGRVYITDPQVGTSAVSADQLDTLASNYDTFKLIRTDDKEINWDNIGICVDADDVRRKRGY